MSNPTIQIPARYRFSDWQKLISASAEVGFWFAPSAMRFASSRISWGSLTQASHDTWLFVSSEQSGWGSPRRYSVRSITAQGDVNTIGEFQGFSSLAEAKRFLKHRLPVVLVDSLERALG